MTEHLGRDLIRIPAGWAIVQTSRPAPDAWWTTTVVAPGLGCDGWHQEHGTADAAIHEHIYSVAVVRRQARNVPTIDLRGGSS